MACRLRGTLSNTSVAAQQQWHNCSAVVLGYAACSMNKCRACLGSSVWLVLVFLTVVEPVTVGES